MNVATPVVTFELSGRKYIAGFAKVYGKQKKNNKSKKMEIAIRPSIAQRKRKENGAVLTLNDLLNGNQDEY